MSKTGLFASVGRLISNLIELVLNRLNLLSADLEISFQRILGILSLFLFGIFLMCMAIFMAVILLVVIFWDTHKVLVIASLLTFFLLGSASLFYVARDKLKKMPNLFEGTLAELKKDHQSLRNKAHHHD